jgi:hypothetical protein
MSLEINPEIRRHIWLELSVARVVTLLVGFGMVVGINFLSASEPLKGAGKAGIFGFTLFAFMAFFRSSKSVSVEVEDNTWDFQRMSSASVWNMTLGKMLGAPIFPLLGAGISIALVGVGFFGRPFSPFATSRLVITLIGVLILVCAVGVMNSLDSTRELRIHRRGKAQMGGLGFILIPFLCWQIPPFFDTKTLMGTSAVKEVFWWGIRFDILNFNAISVLVFMGWAVLAAFRLMQSELQFEQSPWAWTLFCGFLWLYIEPLWVATLPAPTSASLTLIRQGGGFIFSSLLLGEMFSKPKDVIALRKFGVALKQGDISEAWLRTPTWFVTFLFFGLAIAVTMVKVPTLPGRMFVASWFLFVLRDVCVVLSFHLISPNHRRNGRSIFIYLLFAYGLAPLFFGSINGNLGKLFLPMHPVISLLGSMIGAVLALFLLINSWIKSPASRVVKDA